MKKILKFCLFFLIFLAIYSLSYFVWDKDTSFLEKIKTPSYLPNNKVFGVVWPILYVLLSAFFATLIIKKKFDIKSLTIFVFNALSIILYPVVFFEKKELLFAVLICILSLLTGVVLFSTYFKQEKKLCILLIPYIAWSLFAVILQTHIYLIN